MLTFILVSFLFSARSAFSSAYASKPPPWETSKYCNAPHMSASNYPPAEEGAELVHLTVLMRHHKRAPNSLVANELVINDGIKWDCSDVRRFTYYEGGAALYHSVFTPPGQPFAPRFWEGNCEIGQLTPGGFSDSKVHGMDLWELYHGHLKFLHSVAPDEISVRTTDVERTKDVASGVLAGMDPSTAGRPWSVHAQSQLIDSLPPRYKCSRADSLVKASRDADEKGVWTKGSTLRVHLNSVLGTSFSSYLPYQDIITARVCNGHPLPHNITEAQAAEIFNLANNETDYLWHTADNAKEYNQLTFGVMFSELADALKSPTHRLALYVAHDNSIVRIAAGLGIFPLHWPKLGSEFVFETWRDTKGSKFVRVFYDGELINSPSLNWMPLDDFIGLLREQVPKNISTECKIKSESVVEKGEQLRFLVQ